MVAPLLLTVASGLLFGGAVFSDEGLYARDVMNYYWPTRHFAAESFRAGELPQWDASYESGVPALGNIHAAVLYPPHVLYQWLSFPRAYGWLIWLHHLAGGLGTYVLLRRLRLQLQPAVAGAFAFVLSGYVVGLANAGPLMAGVAFVPWVMAVAVDDRPWPWRAGVIAVLLAAQSLTGDPQAVLFSALASLITVLFFPERRWTLAALLVGFVLAAIASAAQLLPAWELLKMSTRAQPTKDFFTSFSFHPIRLLELFFAFPFGKYVEPPFFWPSFAVQGPGALPFALSGYLGAAAGVIAFLGLRRDRLTGLGLTLLGVGLLLALGSHLWLSDWLIHLPPFRFFRYPEKYLLLTSIGSAILVGNGFARLGEGGMRRGRIAFIGASLGVLFVLALVATLGRAFLAANVAKWFAANRLHSDPQAVVEAGLLSMFTSVFWGGLALLLLFRSQVGAQVGYLWGLTMLVGGDLLLAARPLVWTAPNQELYMERPAAVDALWGLSPIHPFRYFRDFFDLERHAPNSLTAEGRLERRKWELKTLKSNLGGVFGLEESSGYGAVSLARWDKVALSLYDQPAKLAAILNVCVVLSSDQGGRFERLAGFKLLANDAQLHLGLFQTPVCLPRIRAVENVQGVGSLDEAVKALVAPDLDLVHAAIAEQEQSRSFEPAEIQQVRQERHRASAVVRAQPGGAFVLFSMAYHPGWQALLDGRKVSQLRVANGAIIGLEVPAGEHRLEFRFSDPLLPWGIGLSVLGFSLIGGILVLSRRKQR
jgi:Bacterial membrane protein YfhO